MTGFRATTLETGTRYVAIHYTADEDKRDGWGAKTKQGVPIREWQREMEMEDSIYDGEPVFADYSDSAHCPLGESLAIPAMKGCSYIGGIDCGATLNPAFVLLQIMERPPYQVHALLEVCSDGQEPMEKFAPRILQAARKLLPGQWDEIIYYGDATVSQRNGANGETAQQAAERAGLKIKPGSNTLDPRLGAVTWLLTDWIDEETPRFIVDGSRCPILHTGFQGAYKLDVSPSGDAVGPGRVLKNRPVKNSFSHVHDALQMAAVPVYKRFARGKDSRETRPDSRSVIGAIMRRER